MAKAKYKVGQEVSVHSGTSPHCNTDCTTVTKVKMLDKCSSGYIGWGYKTANQPRGSHKWFREDALGVPYAAQAAVAVSAAPIMTVSRTTFL